MLSELNAILLVLYMEIVCAIESNDAVERFPVDLASEDAASRPPPPLQRAPSSGGRSPRARENSTSDRQVTVHEAYTGKSARGVVRRRCDVRGRTRRREEGALEDAERVDGCPRCNSKFVHNDLEDDTIENSNCVQNELTGSRIENFRIRSGRVDRIQHGNFQICSEWRMEELKIQKCVQNEPTDETQLKIQIDSEEAPMMI